MKYLKHYLNISMRHLLKHKVHTLFNIGGLSVGLAAVILIFLVASYELSFDKWLPDSDNIYKLESTFIPPGRDAVDYANVSGPALPEFVNYFDQEVGASGSLLSTLAIFTHKDKIFEDRIYYVSNGFFDVFDLEMVAGSRDIAATDDTSIIMNETMARKYFGSESAIGKTLEINSQYSYTVKGVFKDVPRNSHFKPRFFARFDENRYSHRPGMIEGWRGVYFHSYFKLNPGFNIDSIRSRLATFVKNRVPAQGDWIPEERLRFRVVSVPDIYLYSKSRYQLGDFSGDITSVIALIVVAFIILLISAINFTNMSISKAMLRAKEVSMRKVLGGSRKQIIQQIIVESLVTAFIAIIVALLLVNLILPFYNQFMELSLVFNPVATPFAMVFCVVATLVIGLLSGLYPALFMSKFKLGKVLKSNKSSSNVSLYAQNIIVFMQFAVSVGLLVATAIVFIQTKYAQNKDLGFETQNRIEVRGIKRPSLNSRVEGVAHELEKIPGVESVALANNSMPIVNVYGGTVTLPGSLDSKPIFAESFAINEQFFSTFDIEILAGRGFSEAFLGDKLFVDDEVSATAGVVVNLSLLQETGIDTAADAIGKRINIKFGRSIDSNVQIIGVIDDLYLRSLHSAVTPMVYYYGRIKDFRYLTMKLSGENTVKTMAAIDRVWREQIPDIPMSRRFVHNSFEALYKDEVKRGDLFAIYSLFAIFIACIGLYSIASFTIERRTKEIAVRKIMGATSNKIAILMLKQFTRPVIAGAIAIIPFSYWFLSSWLQNFTYRISLNAHSYVFVAGVIIAVIIAWLTVTGHTLKAARQKPVNTLRHD